ncbi:MAG TPA: DUF523 domain-containing protein [Gammaproteobacteria bacterium]|nr:DUF523 domain-containing protein [Gammaproteobacteria bacterium]
MHSDYSPGTTSHRPTIAISRCLLGDRVRYDGKIKNDPQLIDFVKQHFEIICICPEVEIGLSVPRPAVQLSAEPGAVPGTELANIKITGRDDPTLDISTPMYEYCNRRAAQLDSIHGYIFKSKSPSCGIRNIPVFNNRNEIITTTKGVFAKTIMREYPQLPIIDELGLLSGEQREAFLLRVKQYHTCLKNT